MAKLKQHLERVSSAVRDLDAAQACESVGE